ncbi:MAG: cell envelope integrity protein TolA [Pseudomonadota bacterium]
MAFFIAAAAHVGLALGVRPLLPGETEKTAGKPVSVASSLAGILGGEVAPAEAKPEQARPTDPVEVMEPAKAEPTADVETATLARAPSEFADAPPLLSTTSVAPTPTAVPAEPVEAPTARSASPDGVVPRQADDAADVETMASADPHVMTPVVPPQLRDSAEQERKRAETEAAAEARRQQERAAERAARQKRRDEARKQSEAERRKAKAQARARAEAGAKARRAKARAERARQRRANAQRRGTNRQGAAGRTRSGQRGRRAASAGAVASYGARVRARILSNRPGAAGRGRVVVSFGLSRRGRLRYARISRRSGSPAADRAALSAVRRSSPFPRPPAGANSRQLRFSIAFTFR